MAHDERALRLERIGERLSKALSTAIRQVADMGEHELERELTRELRKIELRFQVRVGALQGARRRPLGVAEWDEHVRALRAEYATRPKPPVRLVLAKDSVRRMRQEAITEVLDAG